MSDTPVVSILICTHNAVPYIVATIQSVLAQTYQNIEILIRDNGSSDNTSLIISSFEDNRIKLIQSKENIWPYRWLNRLLEKAVWKYIAIQDHDDIWHPEKIEKQISFLENNHKYIWCGTKTLMRYESDQKWFEYYLWQETYYTIHPSLVFRNNKKHKYPNTVYMADALFQKQILCKWKKCIYNINETLTMHRIKRGAENYSYKRYAFNRQNLKNVFTLHSIWYALLVIVFELTRKFVYPILHRIKIWYLVDKIERLPFVLQGYEIRKYSRNDMKKINFIFS